MRVKIHVTLKEGVLDPQGKAIQKSLGALGFKSVSDVRMGKYFEVELREGLSKAEAEKELVEMCEKLFANVTIEQYSFAIE
ncbi:MAG: phosphoribosylformylglycinamidine synthase subunit PurS [Deltaproteobacteria bacterium]|nr:phosphoribosylformylglycinamidine synthase subunit PurS [Deltaproteobacteria bacterium]